MNKMLFLLLSMFLLLSCQKEVIVEKEVRITDTLVVTDTLKIHIYDSLISNNDTVAILPEEDLGNLIYNYLDLTTFRNSLSSSKKPIKKTLNDLGINPTSISDKQVVFEINEEWHYSFTVTHYKDLTGDGLKDLIILYTSMPIDGRCMTTPQVLLVTRFSPNENLIALSNNPLWAESFEIAQEQIEFNEFGRESDCMDENSDATW